MTVQTMLRFDAALEQRTQLQRVSGRIAQHVASFVNARIGQTFFISELTEYVRQQAGCAPASPDRILRDLRQRKLVAYEIVSRSRSEYRGLALTSVGTGRQ